MKDKNYRMMEFKVPIEIPVDKNGKPTVNIEEFREQKKQELINFAKNAMKTGKIPYEKMEKQNFQIKDKANASQFLSPEIK